MKRLLIAGLALLALATAATAQTPGFYPGGMTAPSGGWGGYQPGMTNGYNQYGNSNYGGAQFGTSNYGGAQFGTSNYGGMNYGTPNYGTSDYGTSQFGGSTGGYSGYPQYASGYTSGGCGTQVSQPVVVYSQPVSSCGCGKKRKKFGGLFR